MWILIADMERAYLAPPHSARTMRRGRACARGRQQELARPGLPCPRIWQPPDAFGPGPSGGAGWRGGKAERARLDAPCAARVEAATDGGRCGRCFTRECVWRFAARNRGPHSRPGCRGERNSGVRSADSRFREVFFLDWDAVDAAQRKCRFLPNSCLGPARRWWLYAGRARWL